MEFQRTEIPDVVLLKPKVFEDERGFFLETYRESEFTAECGLVSFVQDNHSGSRQGTLRGLHYQILHPQGKLIRTIAGEIFDVAVDLRRSSPTFGKWVGAVLSSKNRNQLWIPPCFAHGFYVMSAWAEVIYKTTDYYAPEFERTISWRDPAIGIEWPLIGGQIPSLSEKDKVGNSILTAEIFD